MIKAPKPDHPFWNTRYGGNDIRNATDNARFPILFTTGFYDIYTGGMFDMWKSMSESTRKMSAFVVSPYDHGDSCKLEEFDKTMKFPKGRRIERFGELYEIDWFDYIRGNEKLPLKQERLHTTTCLKTSGNQVSMSHRPIPLKYRWERTRLAMSIIHLMRQGSKADCQGPGEQRVTRIRPIPVTTSSLFTQSLLKKRFA